MRSLLLMLVCGAALAQPYPTKPVRIMVGASAGGVESLRRLVGAIDPEFAGIVFVVLHLPTNAHSFLPKILSRAGTLPAPLSVYMLRTVWRQTLLLAHNMIVYIGVLAIFFNSLDGPYSQMRP